MACAVIELLLAAVVASDTFGGSRPFAAGRALLVAPAALNPPNVQSKPEKPAKKKKKTEEPKSDEPVAASPDEPLDTSDQADVPRGQPAPVRFVWKQHPSLRFGKVLRVDFTAKLQEDGHSSYEGAPVIAGLKTLELHRNRIGIQGTLFKHIEFEVERELTEKELTERDIESGLTVTSPWRDVYVNVDYIDNAQVQAGKFKIPFGLDQLTSVTHNDFVYRSLGAIYLAPARDIGGMVHGRFFKRGLSYWVGGFAHDGDNARSKKIQGGNETFAGRVTAKPFRSLSPDRLDSFELGTAMTVTQVSDDSFRPNGLRGRTAVTQDTFFEPVYVKGQRRRWEADVDWTAGPIGARAEYTRVVDERRNQGLGEEDLPDGRYRSWYVSGTWLLTGEQKVRPAKPENDFLRGGFGALEVAARYERIWFDSVGGADFAFANPRAENILPSGERALTLGVNWILNRFVKIQVNGVREHVEDPARNPVANGAAFWSRVLRLQFVL